MWPFETKTGKGEKSCYGSGNFFRTVSFVDVFQFQSSTVIVNLETQPPETTLVLRSASIAEPEQPALPLLGTANPRVEVGIATYYRGLHSYQWYFGIGASLI